MYELVKVQVDWRCPKCRALNSLRVMRQHIDSIVMTQKQPCCECGSEMILTLGGSHDNR
jgi:hypothetical protein